MESHNLLYKNFLTSPSEKNAITLLYNLRINKYYYLATLIGKYISKIYSYNQSILSETAVSAFYAKQFELSYDTFSKLLLYTTDPNQINNIY